MGSHNKDADATALAVERLREVGRYIEMNAAALIGDITGPYVTEDGIKLTVNLSPREALQLVQVSKEYIVIEK